MAVAVAAVAPPGFVPVPLHGTPLQSARSAAEHLVPPIAERPSSAQWVNSGASSSSASRLQGASLVATLAATPTVLRIRARRGRARRRHAVVRQQASDPSPWTGGRDIIYAQAPVRTPEGRCPDGAVCLPEGECRMKDTDEDAMEESLTKMICTLGPSSSSKEVIHRLLNCGMSIARLNFSHGDHSSQLELLQTVRSAAKESSDSKYYRPVAIMLDTKGPEIRTGRTEDGVDKVEYKSGSTVTLTNDYEVRCTADTVSLSYPKFVNEVKPGSTARIGDGALEIEITDISEKEHGRVKGRVIDGAVIGSKKNVNFPGIKVDLPLLQEKDKHDLVEFALKHEVEFVALSFVQEGKDVEKVRKLLKEEGEKRGKQPPKLISKIENGEGLKNFDDILSVSDGIMVARGDLGMEIAAEQVFMAQKVMIGRCNLVGKFVITATQMLESMTSKKRPTRAEASDVANAVLDGTDCVMLSGETASGKYPVDAADIMTRICREAEGSMDRKSCYRNIESALEHRKDQRATESDEAICHAAARVALDVQARAVIALTESGYTATQIAKYKPTMPIIAVTPSDLVRRQLAPVRGVFPVKSDEFDSTEGTQPIIASALDKAQEYGLLVGGDRVVVVHGAQESRDPDKKMNKTGFSNLVKVVQVDNPEEDKPEMTD